MFRRVSAPRESRRQPRPNGRVPLHAETRTSHVAHVAGFAPPACTGASPCLPERQAARQAGPSHVWGPSQPIPTPEPMRACRASLHTSGARPWPTDRRHKRPHASVAKRAARNISAHRGQDCDTADTTGQPARGSSPERPPPRRHRRARAPRRPWDTGPKSRCKFLYALFCSGLAAGDVGLDAQHDAHGEDADDCGDAGGR